MTARELWGGLAVVSMWLAVLFVGVFGGSIVTSHPPNSSSVPVVVVVALFAVLGTVVVARRAFVASPVSNDLRRAIEDERQAREQLAAEVADLRFVDAGDVVVVVEAIRGRGRISPKFPVAALRSSIGWPRSGRFATARSFEWSWATTPRRPSKPWGWRSRRCRRSGLTSRKERGY
jgi:hypothetical protein